MRYSGGHPPSASAVTPWLRGGVSRADAGVSTRRCEVNREIPQSLL